MFAPRRNNIYIAVCFLLLEIATVFCSTKSGENALNNIDDDNQFENKTNENDFQLLREKIDPKYLVDTVEVKLYYETLCPYCRNFTNQELIPVIEKLGPYLKLYTYPFGNAEMNKTEDGNVTFDCQHGEEECYGNKLDACALARLRGSKYQAVLFNTCMMGPEFIKGSNDEAADKCGAAMSIDVEPIKKCAKGEEGIELLAHYGDESKMAQFSYVPYILINGRKYDDEENNLLRDLCMILKEPPPQCGN